MYLLGFLAEGINPTGIISFGMTSCGPTEEEKAAAEAEAEQMMEDLVGGLENAMDETKIPKK